MKEGLLLIFLLIMATSICDTISQLFLKSSINAINPQVNTVKKVFGFILRLIRTPRVWIGFSFSVLSLFIWLFVLSKADLNFAFSLDSMHYIFITLGSMLVLKEKVGPTRWLGILAIVVGITLVSVS